MRPGPFKKLICGALLVPGRIPVLGRPFREAARVFAGVYKERVFLAYLTPWPWISPRAEWCMRGHSEVGRNVFVDDACVVYCPDGDGRLVLGDRVQIHRGTIIHLGLDGSLEVGPDSSIQAYCTLTACGRISIGKGVLISPHCAFYPYDHEFSDANTPILAQKVRRRGGIEIQDDVWIGYGSVILDGVTIGRGCVVAAGSVVPRSLPPFSIAAGNPARVVGRRDASS